LTDAIFSAVHHLVREDGPFVSALAQAQDAWTAIARALQTIEADVPPPQQCGAGGVRRLEALLHARLLDGQKRGDVAADLDIGDLSAFYANVAVSLVVEALSGGDAERLAAIRRVAMRILPHSAAVLA
jgi:hypothetical protein